MKDRSLVHFKVRIYTLVSGKRTKIGTADLHFFEASRKKSGSKICFYPG